MIPQKKRILLKITGEVFLAHDHTLSSTFFKTIIAQLQQLASSHQFGIVIGGGNIFRGSEQGLDMGIQPPAAHQAGMLATMINGIFIKDLLDQAGILSTLFCAVPSPEIGLPIAQQSIIKALGQGSTLIFTGGTGNPFFTTDTNAVLRSLQIGAQEIWKATNVDGLYTSDPRVDSTARFIKHTTYAQALTQQLGVMDHAAFALARQHKQRIRIFNIFSENALLNAAHNEDFGSIITEQ